MQRKHFARYAAQSKHAGLWTKLAGVWSPSFSNAGSTLHDLSNAKHDATLNHTLSGAWKVEGGRKAIVNTSGKYAVVDTNLTNDKFDYPFTVSVWIHNIAAIGDKGLVAKAKQEGAYKGWMIYMNSSSTVVAYWNGGSRSASMSIATNEKQWRLITMQWTGSEAKLWTDADLNVSSSTAIAPNASNTDLRIGAYEFGANNRSMQGNIGTVYLWRRVISKSEIELIYGDHLALFRRQKQTRVSGSLFQIAWAARSTTIAGVPAGA